MGVDNLSFYGPSWLWAHASLLFGVLFVVLTVATTLARLAVRRFAPTYWPLAKRLIIVVWIVGVILVLVDLYVLDVMQRQDLVPEWLGGIRR